VDRSRCRIHTRQQWHKAATNHEQFAAYLEALRAHKPKRGRRRTAESIEKRLAAIDDALAEASPIDELLLRQELRSLQAELDSMTVEQTIEDVESAFVEVAKSYSERKGIEYLTWRDLGVSAEVLRRAGVKR
jgi:hypothetical protein